jgi:hypothetical protein
MESDRFKIIFEKVRAAGESPSESLSSLDEFEAIKVEADAVAELREIVLETLDPPSKLYTTT